MSQAQIQNPPIYTREELEEALRAFGEFLEYLAKLLEKAEKSISEIYYILYYKTGIDTEIASEIAETSHNLKIRVYDAIDELIVDRLQLDTDIDKYEKQYNVRFDYTEEKLLGVVMLSENETVKPVVIWTDYKSIGYYEGKKNE